MKRVAAGFFLLFGAVYLGLALQYPLDDGSGRPGAGMFPTLTGASLVIVSGWNLVRDWRAGPEPTKRDAVKDVLVAAGIIAGFLVMLGVLGTTLATLLFSLGFLAYFRKGRWVQNIIFSIAMTLGVELAFGLAFHADMPAGVLGIPTIFG